MCYPSAYFLASIFPISIFHHQTNFSLYLWYPFVYLQFCFRYNYLQYFSFFFCKVSTFSISFQYFNSRVFPQQFFCQSLFLLLSIFSTIVFPLNPVFLSVFFLSRHLLFLQYTLLYFCVHFSIDFHFRLRLIG